MRITKRQALMIYGAPATACAPIPEDLTLTDDEKRLIRAAIDAKTLTRIGATLYGTEQFFPIKKAHGWSWGQLKRAIDRVF